MQQRLAILPFLLSACVAPDAPTAVGSLFSLWDVERHDVTPRVGGAPLPVQVRALNAWGAPVPGAQVEIRVGETTETVTLDAYGFGHVTIASPGTTRVAVGDSGATVHATDATAGALALPGAVPALDGVIAVAAAARGTLVATAEAVFHVALDGTRVEVLRPPGGAIRGVHAAHLDRDGVIDAVVWTRDVVIGLRGRPDGGVGWSFGLRADGQEVGGVAVGDTTADGRPDVAVAWVSGARTLVEVWESQGLEDYTFAAAVPVDRRVVGLAAGDNAGTGTAQLTATRDDGEWSRVARDADGTYGHIGPAWPQLVIGAESGTRPASAGDYNGDGAAEVFLFGPRATGVERNVQVWGLQGSTPTLFSLTALGAHVDLRDAQGDGLVDLWTLAEDGDLSVLTWADGLNTRRRVGAVHDFGPIAAFDHDGDAIPELFVAGATLWAWHPGAEHETNPWTEAAADTVRFAVDARAAVVAADLDGNPTQIEIVTFGTDDDEGATVELFRLTPGPTPTLTHVDSLPLSPTGDPRDLAVCGTTVYALASDRLAALTFAGGVQATVMAGGHQVACGNAGGGVRVAVARGDRITLHDLALQEVGQRTEAAHGVAFVGSEIAACADPGCGITGWAWNAEGGNQIARTDAAGIEVGSAPPTRLPGAGALITGDLDGDGHPDLIAAQGAWIATYPSTGAGYGVGRSYRASAAVVGRPAAIDADADGADDLLWVDPFGGLVLTRAAGGW